MQSLFQQIKEIFVLFFHFHWKELFLSPTENSLLQFCRYALVGVISTIVDWGILSLFTDVVHFHYLLAAPIAYLTGIIVNYYCSRLFVFSGSTSRFDSRRELLGYILIGVIGLALTELILFLLVNLCAIKVLVAKAISTALVLLWNFFARKKLLYR